MRKLIIEMIGTAGLVAFSAGVYLQFGVAPALMIVGGALTLGAIAGTKRGQR
ncbi:hypothetical protein ACR0ST_04350 [Aliidiomarina sp. Khilg15.8]